MQIGLAISILLSFVKLFAWYKTSSGLIFSDAMESLVNVLASIFAVYAIGLSAKPKDLSHPYGHGKAEFISAGLEGGLILIAGLVIIVDGVGKMLYPQELYNLELGLYLVAFAGLVNLMLGYILNKKGKETNSLALIADGKHLMADFWSSMALIFGLFLVKFTGLGFLDGFLACGFGIFIMIPGYKVVRKALSGLMDETDTKIVEELVAIMQQNRMDTWIDIHKLRVQSYGNVLHLDMHVTMPWYIDLRKNHDDIKLVENAIKKNFNRELEFSVHLDPCSPISCGICKVENCLERLHNFEGEKTWTLELLMEDAKHTLD